MEKDAHARAERAEWCSDDSFRGDAVVGKCTCECGDDVLAPVVKIEVPAHLNLGNVTPGFSSERVRVDIDNVGTTAVAVIPQLEDANEEIFKYLSFTRRTTEPYAKIGDFTFFLSRPSVPGKIESDYFYAKLDLSTFQGSVKEDVFGRQARVVFWVLPQ